MAIIAALVILLIAAPAAHAADHAIGGTAGWTNFGNVDYDTWSSAQKFKVGDNIVFNYGASHSVAEVSQSDYSSCDSSNAIQTYSDGATSIPLSAAGTRYFICPAAGHCSGGMKIAVKVDGGSSSGGGSPSTPATPTTPSESGSGSGSGSTTPSDSEPTTPSGSGGSSKKEPSETGSYGAATSVLYNVVFGSAVVLATTMVALLG
ncbi:Blue copper protein [Linum perenne]